MAASAPASAHPTSDNDDPQPVLPEAACALARAKHEILKMVDLYRVAEAANATNDGVDDYKKFLAILAMFVERKDSAYETLCKPSADMDAVWHAHILDTKAYKEMNDLLLNGDGFIHHDPYSGKDPAVKLARRKFMGKVFKQVFGTDPKQGWGPLETHEEYNKRLTGKKRRRASASAYQIFVNTLQGKTKTFRMDSDFLVEDVKLLLHDAGEAPVDQQRLIYAGRQLEDGHKLCDCGIVDMCTLHLVLRLSGC